MCAENLNPSNPNTFWAIAEEFTVGDVVVAVSRSKDQYPRYSLRVGTRRGQWLSVELLTTDHLPAITAAVAKAQDWIHAEQSVHQRLIDEAAAIEAAQTEARNAEDRANRERKKKQQAENHQRRKAENQARSGNRR